MTMHYETLKNWSLPDIRQTLTKKETMLYALSLGLGADPMDERQLRFVYEKDLIALPTMAVVLAPLGFWMKNPATGVDWKKILHGEQAFTLHEPLPVAGELIGRSRIVDIFDKGPGKGALVLSERVIMDAASERPIATLQSTSFLRGDGGCGGPGGKAPPPHSIPNRKPDLICDLATLPQTALLYRLNGDDNPLHADPEVAASAGFKQPILHGLGTLGVAGHALLKSICDYDPTRLRQLKLRFSSPVYPGETVRTEMWVDGDAVSFRSSIPERGQIVLDNGLAKIL